MQLRKPLAPRAEVDGQALELMRQIAIVKCNQIADAAKSRRRIVSADRVLLNKILPLARGEERALEQLRADLCGLPLQTVTVAASPSRVGTFIHGVTRTILVDLIRVGGSVDLAAYDIGEYDVYLHQSIFVGGSMGEDMHFVPRRNPRELARHWHHVAYYENDDFAAMHARTCMNTYGSIFADLSNNLAFAEFLRIVHNFLSHYYYGSPLGYPSGKIARYLK